MKPAGFQGWATETSGVQQVADESAVRPGVTAPPLALPGGPIGENGSPQPERVVRWGPETGIRCPEGVNKTSEAKGAADPEGVEGAHL